MAAGAEDFQEPRREEERRGAHDDVGPPPVGGAEDPVDGELDGLVAVEVLPHPGAAARQEFARFGECPVVEPEARVERVFLDLLPEPGEGF